MNIFDYNDYKKCLRDHLAAKPSKGRGEYARIAKHLGVHSSLISQVMSGNKDFTPEQLQEITGYLGFSEAECEHLLFLLERDRAGTKKLKDYWQKKIDEVRKSAQLLATRLPKESVLSEKDRSIFYSSWIYSAVRIFTSVDDGKTLDEICLRFEISRERAMNILKFLSDGGLVTSEGGVFRVGPQVTHLGFGSPFLVKHHTNWRLQSIKCAENLTEGELMFTGPLTIGRSDFKQVKEEITQLIRSVSKRVKETTPEDIACLNVDWFWLKK